MYNRDKAESFDVAWDDMRASVAYEILSRFMNRTEHLYVDSQHRWEVFQILLKLSIDIDSKITDNWPS